MADNEAAGAIEELIGAFGRLPGIGAKSAERLAHHIAQVNRRRGAQACRGDPQGQGPRPQMQPLLPPY